MQMNIAIIPARGGSKRIPRKNIKEFCGKPMLAYAINAAKESGLFNHVIVSTDDAEIAQIANKCGALTPFVRPCELANDYTPTVPVISHAIYAVRDLGWQFENVCCIYPSVPFIQINDLIDTLKHIIKNNVSFCFPITNFPSSIQRAFRILNDGRLAPFNLEFENVRTQDIEEAYYDAGQFYWGTAETWLTKSNIHSNGLGHLIPNWRVVDIDTPEDWLRAELLYGFLNNDRNTLRGIKKC